MDKVDANVLTREYCKKRISEIDDKLRSYGCQDNSCWVVKHRGMGTNGGCRCVERGDKITQESIRNVRAAMILYREKIQLLEELCVLHKLL